MHMAHKISKSSNRILSRDCMFNNLRVKVSCILFYIWRRHHFRVWEISSHQGEYNQIVAIVTRSTSKVLITKALNLRDQLWKLLAVPHRTQTKSSFNCLNKFTLKIRILMETLRSLIKQHLMVWMKRYKFNRFTD